MLPTVKGATERFLTDVGRIQSNLDDVSRQLSSTIRVGRASDDPSSIPEILGTFSGIAGSQQMLNNLGLAKTELLSGDAALTQAMKVLDHAIALGTQGSSNVNGADPAVLAEQVKAVQQFLLAAANTQVNGRYIFSGDLDQQPQYELDATDPSGVKQLTNAASTRAVTDSGGATIWTAPTAQQLFDAKNADGTTADTNVFQAVSDLLHALQSGDITASAAATGKLKLAQEHLGQQQGLIGIATNRVDDTTTVVSRQLISQRQALSELRDADIPAQATLATQLNMQQEAALSARAKISQLGLFDYLG